MPVTLDQLVERVDRDYRAASETLDFLPTFIDPNAPDTVNVQFADGARAVPTLKKLTAAIDQAVMQQSMDSIRGRVDQLDTLSHGMISALSQLGAANGPTWNSYDLSDTESVADMTDPMFRANIEGGVRFPFDAYIVVNIDRRNPADWTKIGNVLLPPNTNNVIRGYVGSLDSGIVAAHVDIANYPGIKIIVNEYTYNAVTQRIGGYYANSQFYDGKKWVNTRVFVPATTFTYYSQSSRAVFRKKAVEGSQIAQTFQVQESAVLKGIRLWAATAGSTLVGEPSVLITETSYGMPDTNKVIGTATVVRDTAFSLGQGTDGATNNTLTETNYLSFAMDAPVYLQAGKSYAFVVVTPIGQSYRMYIAQNTNSYGGLFYTQDSAMWTQDIERDVLFSLVTASFTPGTHYIEINPLSVSGGIASIKSEFLAITPEDTDLALEVDINGAWRDIGVLDSIDQLPPYTPVRLKVLATAKAAPLIDTVNSRITAFRAASSLRFTSKPRAIRDPGRIRVSVSTMGYDPYDATAQTGFHTINFSCKCDGETTMYSPVRVTRVFGSNGLAQFEVVFDVPTTKREYQLSINGSTTLATRVYDVSSIVEI